MILSAALDSGLAFGVVVVFFVFLYPGWRWLSKLEWWGTKVYKEVSSRGRRYVEDMSFNWVALLGLRLASLSLQDTRARRAFRMSFETPLS